MKLRTKRLFATLLTGVLATSMLFNDAVPVQADSLIKPATPYVYNTSDPLFAATHFHFFAKEYAEIKTHCHGNVAAKEFSAGSNSGSDKMGAAVKSEIFYFQEIDASKGFNANFAGATVVLGKDITTSTMNNAEVYLETGSNKIKIEPNSTIYQETATSGRFIDFEAEFEKLEKLSVGLAGQLSIDEMTTAGTPTGITVQKDASNYTIDLSAQNPTVAQTAYIHINANDMAGINDFKIINIDDFTNGEAIVINYELPSGTTDYTLPFTKIIVQDAASGNLNSRENWGIYTGHGNILWNFYTIENGVKTPYSGTLNTCSEFKGTILAPKATIKLASSNQDGNFIGTNVYGGGGQTHRWDFGGSLPRTFGSDSSIEDTEPTGALEIIVREEGSGTPINGATVKISSTDVNNFTPLTFTTDQNGRLIVDSATDKTVLDNLKYGTYTAEIVTVPTGYDATGVTSQNATINSAATIQKIFEIPKENVSTPTVKTGSLNVFVRDGKTNAYISGVTVKLYDPNNQFVCEMVTDASGYTTTTATGLTIDSTKNYTVKVTGVPSGYVLPTTDETQAIYNSSLHTVPIYLQKEATGTIQATIKDDKYNCAIPGTSIQIIDENGTVIQTLATNAEGKTDVSMPLPLNKTYTVQIYGNVPNGSDHAHPTPTAQTVKLTTDNPNVVVPFVTSPDPHGSLMVQIIDKNTNLPIKDATVTVTNKYGDVVKTVTTDENGWTSEINNLIITNDPVNGNDADKFPYKVTVTSVPKGYTAPDPITNIYITDSAAPKKETLYVAQAGSFIPTIVDSKTGDKIQGASVTVTGTYSDGTSFTITDTTDANGQIPIIENIKVSTSTEKSEVKVVVNSVPAGYNMPNDETVEIKDNTKPTEKTLEVVKKTGSLQATIIDENTKEEIKDAYVTITNQKGEIVYEGKTDENGQTPEIKDLPILEDYKIHTNSVPHGYTPPADYTARVENETPMTSVTLEVKTSTDETDKGSLQATIIDKNTKDPIKDATVEIKDSTGKVIATGKTDKDGKTPVISGLTINNTYTVHTSSVPDGYTAPGDQDITIKDDELTTVDLTVAKTTPDTGSLQAVITDKNTKEPIANATVEIKNGAGNIIATVKTDKDGLTPIVSNLTIGTTYTIHVIEVPSGYTAPDDKSQLIASAALFKVELVVAKSADTTVQTGDNTNPFGVGMVGILSLIAFIVLVSKKREA